MTGETRRQVEHLGMIAFAFLLRWLTWGQAAACAVAAIGYGQWISPRINRAGVRPGERERGFSVGKFSYAFGVLVLILVFRQRMHVAAGAWAVLALGDSLSNIAGRAWGRARLPWSRSKTWVGSLAFFLTGWLGAALLVFWTVAGTGAAVPGTLMTILACGAAALAGAIVESLPLKLDDNLTSTAAAALVLALTL